MLDIKRGKQNTANSVCNIFPVHFIFRFLFFVSLGDEVTKISCHFQAKSVLLIFFVFRHFDQNTKNEKCNEPDNNKYIIKNQIAVMLCSVSMKVKRFFDRF